jgi:hypothetical protein
MSNKKPKRTERITEEEPYKTMADLAHEYEQEWKENQITKTDPIIDVTKTPITKIVINPIFYWVFNALGTAVLYKPENADYKSIYYNWHRNSGYQRFLLKRLTQLTEDLGLYNEI